jgi:glucose-1-phosphate thymidylyltransferase
MIAVILCAGFATRMYPLTEDFPKPLLPVAGRPVIDYLMDHITCLSGLHKVHIVTNAKFFRHFESWQSEWMHAHPDMPITIQLYNDGATSNENRLGASVDLQFVFHRIFTPSRVLVSAGDNIFRFSFTPLWKHFLKSQHHYVVALEEKDPLRLKKTGVLELGENNRVINFYEKPEHPPSTWCCPALYFLQPSAWARLDDFVQSTSNTDAPGHFIQFLCQKEEVYGYIPHGFHLDIGSIDTYQKADRLIASETREGKNN